MITILLILLFGIFAFYKKLVGFFINIWINLKRWKQYPIVSHSSYPRGINNNILSKELSNARSNLYYKYDGLHRIIMIGSYDLSKEFYSKTKKNLQREHTYLGKAYDILFRECIGTKWGETWLKMKKPLDGYFNNGSVKNYYNELDICIDKWVEQKLGSGSLVQVKPSANSNQVKKLRLGDLGLDKLTMKFLAIMVFGKISGEDLGRLYELADLHEKVMPLMNEYSPIRYGFKLGFSKEHKSIHNLNKKWIEFAVSLLEKSKGLVEHFANEHTYMNDKKKIIHTLYEIILFNADIMTNAITHLIWDMAMNNNIQTKLINAIKNCDEIYIDKIILESARLHPGVLNTFTDLITEDLDMDGYIFRAGTMFSLDTLMINTSDIIWEKPYDFNPDRYNDGNMNKVHRFGLGQRRCIGRIPADIILQKVIKKIFSMYEIFPSSNKKQNSEENPYKNIATGCIDNFVEIQFIK